MRKTSLEAWLFVLIIIGLIVVPVIVGIAVVKAYRKYKPLKEAKTSTNAIAAIQNINRDGFFKTVFIGWVLCGPAFYFVYTNYLAHT